MERNDLDFARHLPVIHDIRMSDGNIPCACEIYFVLLSCTRSILMYVQTANEFIARWKEVVEENELRVV